MPYFGLLDDMLKVAYRNNTCFAEFQSTCRLALPSSFRKLFFIAATPYVYLLVLFDALMMMIMMIMMMIMMMMVVMMMMMMMIMIMVMMMMIMIMIMIMITIIMMMT